MLDFPSDTREIAMPLKTLTAAVLFVLSAGIAAAACSDMRDSAQSCAPGSVWDAGSGRCVVHTTS